MQSRTEVKSDSVLVEEGASAELIISESLQLQLFERDDDDDFSIDCEVAPSGVSLRDAPVKQNAKPDDPKPNRCAAVLPQQMPEQDIEQYAKSCLARFSDQQWKRASNAVPHRSLGIPSNQVSALHFYCTATLVIFHARNVACSNNF